MWQNEKKKIASGATFGKSYSFSFGIKGQAHLGYANFNWDNPIIIWDPIRKKEDIGSELFKKSMIH